MNEDSLKPAVVEVLLFAGAAAAVEAKSVRLELPGPATVSDVAKRLGEQFPVLRALAQASRWAVESEFVSPDFQLSSGAQLAMIPPVSGG